VTAMTRPRTPELTPADCLRRLPEPTLEITGSAQGDDLRRIELRRSTLAIAELDHISETALVRAVVTNALGDVPGAEG